MCLVPSQYIAFLSFVMHHIPLPCRVYLVLGSFPFLLFTKFFVFQGTKELGEVLKSPSVVGELCQVMGTSAAPQVRQYAAVILRKRLGKTRHWMKLEADVKNGYAVAKLPSYLEFKCLYYYTTFIFRV